MCSKKSKQVMNMAQRQLKDVTSPQCSPSFKLCVCKVEHFADACFMACLRQRPPSDRPAIARLQSEAQKRENETFRQIFYERRNGKEERVNKAKNKPATANKIK